MRHQLAIGALAVLALAAPSRAKLRSTYSQVGSITPTVSMRDVAVNKNPDSPYYGYVYVTNVTGKNVKILRPDPVSDGTGATSFVDTGLTITSATAAGNTPFGVSVSSDDTVWLANFDTGFIETAPPVPTVGSDVVAVQQFKINTSQPRSLYVTGTVSNARVYVVTQAINAQLYTGGSAAWDQAGTFTHQWTTDVKQTDAGVQVGYGITADSAGNTYVALGHNAAGAGLKLIRKVNADGTIDAAFGGARPAYTTIANSLPDVDIVEDASAPGGGYLYWSGRQVTATVNKRLTHRYRLDDGAWLDSFGPPAATGFTPPTDGTYTVLDLNNAASPNYFGTDDKGNLYLNSDNQITVRKVFRKAPFVVDAAAATSAGAPVKSSPTAVDGVVYFGADDGKLYAYTTADGNPVAGFPVDISAYVGASVQLLGRPAVYFGTGGKAIYLTTSRGDVVKVNPDGTPAWKNSVYAGTGTNTATAPAVTTDGFVFAAVSGVHGVQVMKLMEDSGDFVIASAVIADPPGTASSPAVFGNRVYVGTEGGNWGDLLVLSIADLTIQADFAPDEGVKAPPFVNGPNAYVGTLAGNLHKINSATLIADPLFGPGGSAAIGEPIVTDAFAASGLLYVGTTAGKVFSVDQVLGTSAVVHDTGDATAVVGGLTVRTPTGNVAFGTSAGKFYVVQPGLAVNVYGGYGAFPGAPTYDASTQSFFAGSADTNVYKFGEIPMLLAE